MGCIRHFSCHCDERPERGSLKEGELAVDPGMGKLSPSWKGWQDQRGGSGLWQLVLMSWDSLLCRSRRGEIGLELVLPLSDPLPPTRSHLLKVLQSPQTVPLAGNHVFKYRNSCGHFTWKPEQEMTYVIQACLGSSQGSIHGKAGPRQFLEMETETVWAWRQSLSDVAVSQCGTRSWKSQGKDAPLEALQEPGPADTSISDFRLSLQLENRLLLF